MNKKDKLISSQQLNSLLARLLVNQQPYFPMVAEDLVICADDFIRENELDRCYRKIYKNKLCSLFNNKCAICLRQDNGLDLDHFFIPKIRGGSFILRFKDSKLVNNAVPLCQTCNRQKSSRISTQFFTSKINNHLFLKNNYFSQIISLNHHRDIYNDLSQLLRKYY